MLVCGPRRLPRKGGGGACGRPTFRVLASRRLRGPGWARSRRIPGRAAPPLSRPGGRRLPPATPTPTPPKLDHGRWWPQAPQAGRTRRTALPSPPLRRGRLRSHLPDPVGWTLWASAGHPRHRLDTFGGGGTALFPRRRRGPDRRDAAPRCPRAPHAAAAAAGGGRPRAARCPGQCPAQGPPQAGARDLGHAPLEAWAGGGLERCGAGSRFRRGAPDPAGPSRRAAGRARARWSPRGAFAGATRRRGSAASGLGERLPGF